MKDNKIIKCPNCNQEYLPGEIFLPKYFLGQPKDIYKTTEGTIDICEGIIQDTSETYICDKCDCKFTVKASINYSVAKVSDLPEGYISDKYTNRITLKEE